jgi:NitT/TauT family transport system permease protein
MEQRTRKSLLSLFSNRFMSLGYMVLIWWVVSLFYHSFSLPTPQRVFLDVIDILGGQAEFVSSYVHIAASVYRIAVGFSMSMIVGTIMGLAMGWKRTAEEFFNSWNWILLVFPAVVWTFIFVMWFGTNDFATIMVVFAIVLPYVTVNIWQGAKGMDKGIIEMAHVYGANRSLMISDVYIPHLTPYIFSASRISFALSIKIITIAEVVGASTGVGAMISYFWSMHDLAAVLAWGLFMVFLILIVDQICIKPIEKKALKWRPKMI